jgi:hypothetical protein
MGLDDVVGRTFAAAGGFQDQNVIHSFAITRTTKGFEGVEGVEGQSPLLRRE